MNQAEMVELVAASDGSEQVIHPFLGGKEMLNKLVVDRWVIDIPEQDLRTARSKYPAAFKHLAEVVLGVREEKAREQTEKNAAALADNPKTKVNSHHIGFLQTWWQLSYRRREMLSAIAPLSRYIATSRVATVNRPTVFEFVDASIHPSDAMTVFALDDDYSMGVLSSSIHQSWIAARCFSFKGDPRYTSTTVWDCFPFPQAPSSDDMAAVRDAMSAILYLREEALLDGETLAVQYDDLRMPGKNQLRELHHALDAAVFKAYGFSPEDEILTQLLALNLELADQPSLGRSPGPWGLEQPSVTGFKIAPPQMSLTK
ncbi:type IIL restriction-modification enzyme MmeI [Arthrobacter sp. VKM Ac-2550]|uniref:type IIL restriction-modification enzyme MmeI n=1 Tax=Crystallibacter permensis TaxID=1938888 RepID=UPI0022265655|nr:type IIL restriction-modification enzyme MmeI [Arthrobacter sp. VKM Ac-2550]